MLKTCYTHDLSYTWFICPACDAVAQLREVKLDLQQLKMALTSETLQENATWSGSLDPVSQISGILAEDSYWEATK
jgi:hypothetical protein